VKFVVEKLAVGQDFLEFFGSRLQHHSSVAGLLVAGVHSQSRSIDKNTNKNLPTLVATCNLDEPDVISISYYQH
jgi:hypothetical protein